MATLSACGTPSHVQKVSPEPGKASDLKNQQLRQQARQLLDKQEYVATLNFIRDEILKGAKEQALAEEYLEAANTCLEHADNLMEIGDYSGAAMLFKTVQESYPKAPALQHRVTLTQTQISDQLVTCAEKLMETGLVAYRAEEFTKSIDIWQQILVFNPEHQAALDAIETTRQQISRLKALKDKE